MGRGQYFVDGSAGTIFVWTSDWQIFFLCDASTGQLLRRVGNQTAAVSTANTMAATYRTPT